ncbi:hypothetical protein ACVHNB_32780 [Streptomyces sp. YJ-C3]
MTIQLRFIGGPADGRTYEIPDEAPPPLYLIPIVPSASEPLTAHLEPTPTNAAEYEPLRDAGWPRRADDGAFLYRHRVPPVTPEERPRLERDRRDAAEREKARQAEMAESWRQIREERPHYPEDWRDL